MNTADKLRAAWDNDAQAKIAWKQVTELPIWRQVTALVAAEMTETARRIGFHDVDTQIVRRLKELDGGLRAMELLNSLWWPKPESEPPIEEYSDEYMERLRQEKLTQQQ